MVTRIWVGVMQLRINGAFARLYCRPHVTSFSLPALKTTSYEHGSMFASQILELVTRQCCIQ
jgi:hypothetical protein